MTDRTRRRRGIAVAALAATLGAAGVAQADITARVVSPAGVALPGVDVTVRDASGSYATSGTTGADGRVTFTTSSLTGDTAPFTLSISQYDSCRSYTEPNPVTAQSAPVADGAALDLTVDVRDFCAVSYVPSGSPPATGLVDVATRRILSAPGGIVYLQVLAPSGATGFQVLLSDHATVIGSGTDASSIRVTAPAAGYEGPLFLRQVVNGATVDRDLGTLVARKISPPVPLPGPIDIEAIVDVSGSMAGTDPKFVRKDALRLLVDLARPGDTLGAVGFDSAFKAIFAPRVITAAAGVLNALKAAVDRNVVNRGGTDYNVGMDEAYKALTGPGIDPNRQKGIVFLTDGANGSTYQNGHLRFAENPSGRTWPVCAVQLGPRSTFRPADVALLRRIASETGGRYFATTSAADLTDIYFRCFGLTTGQRTLLTKTFVFKAGQTRAITQRLPKGLGSATFFVNGGGSYRVVIIDPRGRRHTATKPLGKGFTFRQGKTFALVRVLEPAAGRWTLSIQALKLPAPTDKARASVTVPRRH